LKRKKCHWTTSGDETKGQLKTSKPPNTIWQNTNGCASERPNKRKGKVQTAKFKNNGQDKGRSICWEGKTTNLPTEN